MFEVATLSGNNIDSACAIKAKTKSIMGHIISSAAGKDNKTNNALYSSGRRSSFRKSKRETQRQDPTVDSILRAKNEANRTLNNGQVAPLPDRPVTINAFRYENNISRNTAEDIINGNESVATINEMKPFSSKEFHKSGESYHKTGVCFYKGVDGVYHKLPHDSYHKMTESCYVKLQNGTFRRFEDINNDIVAQNDDDQVQLRVKNHVKRFLNRSKSHTPATLKEKQRYQQQLKDKELPETPTQNSTFSHPSTTAHNSSTHQQSQNQQPQNRRVMVTMIEGGMPVVATSKTGTTKSAKSKNRNSANKVK